MSKKIQIDPTIKALIPPLQPEEFAALEQSIVNDGCRDALVVWKGILVDGHNRYEICMKHGKPFRKTELKCIDTREGVLLWMINTQLGRRNLTDFQRCELVLKQKELIAARAKKKQEAGINQHSSLSTNLSKAPAIDTRRELAGAAGVSEGTVAKVEKIQIHAAPEVIEAVRAGDVKIDVAAQVAELPLDEQAALATKGKAALKAAAKQVRNAKKKHPTNKPTPPVSEKCLDTLQVAPSDLEALRIENAALRTENAALHAENSKLKELIAQLQADSATLPDRVQPEQPPAQVTVLEAKECCVPAENCGVA